MSHLLLSYLGTAAATSGDGMKGMLVSFGPFIIIIVVMYFLLFRSQQKKARQRQEMLSAVRAGDKVCTTGGLIGVVASVKDKSVMLKIADNVKVEINRSAVSVIMERADDESKPAKK